MSEFNKWQEYKALSDSEFYIAKESWDYQQAKIDDSENTRAVLYRENIDLRERSIELQKRIDVVLEYLDGESSNRWGLWKEKADMMEQGASNAFEEAYWMVKKALRGAND